MLLNCIKERYSVRKFQDKVIEHEKMDVLLKAAQLAPSAKNTLPCKFVVIRNEEKRKKLTDICKGQKFVSQAPITIAICANNIDYTMTCGQKAYTIDAAIAAEHIVLQATEMGLGTCWIGAFFHDKMAELINLPKDYKIVALLPIGYPAVEKGKRDLKSIEEVVVWDSF
ncbi:MAG: nitroreductase family protein [Candidatus Cloacimonetes bacterium]|nr:nitroreductase family protein [Candidatus Cloacimonadota bacterium]